MKPANKSEVKKAPCKEVIGAGNKGGRSRFGVSKVMVLHLTKKKDKVVVRHGVYRNGTQQMTNSSECQDGNDKVACSISKLS